MAEKQVVTKKGVSVTIYPTPFKGKESYTLSYFIPGESDRLRERATGTIEAAKVRAEQIIDQISGGAHAVTERNFSAKELSVFANVDSILQDIKVDLSTAIVQYRDAFHILQGKANIVEAAVFYAKHTKKAALKPKMFPDVVDEFLQNIKDRKLSPHYVRTSTYRLNSAKEAFNRPIADIEHGEIDEWLTSFKGRNFKNYRDILITVFNFAKSPRRQYLMKDDTSAAELAMEGVKSSVEAVTFLPVSDYRRLLEITPARYMPLVAIGGMAGIRTSEIHRLDWKDINLGEGFITIQAKNAKTAARRIVPICTALKAWLSTIKKRSGPVMVGFSSDQMMTKMWQDMKQRFTNADGSPLILSQNVLRHSYATYRLAMVQDSAKVSLEMGNSPRMLFQSYRNLATPKEAEEFFGIFPRRRVLE